MIVIDPSVHACGWATFAGSDLVSAGVLQPQKLDHLADLLIQVLPWREHHLCLIERPRIYPHSPVPPNDIVTLGIAVGIATALARQNGLQVRYVFPTTLNKTVTTHRVQKTVDTDQLLCDIPKSLRHNAIDAIHLGQLEVKK